MSIDAGVSIVISFLGFCWIFAKKVYPFITKNLDEHIESVKEKIASAERLKEEAVVFLERAKKKEAEIDDIIATNRLKSEQKIKKLQEENEKLLKMLKERHEISLKTQLETEFVKQKNQLIDRIADLIIEKMHERVNSDGYKFSTIIEKEDLKKLINSK